MAAYVRVMVVLIDHIFFYKDEYGFNPNNEFYTI